MEQNAPGQWHWFMSLVGYIPCLYHCNMANKVRFMFVYRNHSWYLLKGTEMFAHHAIALQPACGSLATVYHNYQMAFAIGMWA